MPVTKKVQHKLSGKFKWALPFDLTPEEAEQMMLIKGVAMQSGKLKSKDVMTYENVIAGGGALRAAALMGNSNINIDHIDDELPEKYKEKFGKEIGDKGIVGFVIDSQPVTEGQTAEVEYLGVLENRTVYNMVKEGKVKGNSVEDASRNKNCDGETCEFEGSAYINNALIVLEVPNSSGTWTDTVNEHDIGSIITKSEKQNHSYNKVMERLIKHKERFTKHDEDDTEKKLTKYMTDGIWNDGLDSVKEFLKNEKEIENEEFAQFVFDHPTEFNQWQLEYNSGADMIGWWDRFKRDEQMFKDVEILKKNMAMLALAPQNKNVILAKHETKEKHYNPLGQDQVNYKNPSMDEEMKCIGCRWFSPEDFETPEGVGSCAIVTNEVMGNGGCDRFEKNNAIPDEPKEEDEEGDIDNPEQPEDGNEPDKDDKEEDMAAKKTKQTGQKEPVPAENNKIDKMDKIKHSIKSSTTTIIKQGQTEKQKKKQQLTKCQRLEQIDAEIQDAIRTMPGGYQSAQVRLDEIAKLNDLKRKIQESDT